MGGRGYESGNCCNMVITAKGMVYRSGSRGRKVRYYKIKGLGATNGLEKLLIEPLEVVSRTKLLQSFTSTSYCFGAAEP